MKPFRIEFLGTGTSQGVPTIGCDCKVCTSTNPKDRRLRSSILVSQGDINIVVDSGPDFRQQMLRAGVKDLKAILYTHEHNDHIVGIDDIRPFNFKHWRDMPLYATLEVQKDIKQRFPYAFIENKYPGAPMLKLETISAQSSFSVENIEIVPIEVLHGKLPVMGFRFGDFTYITDMKTIEDREFEKLKGTKVLVLNALHYSEHHSHLNVDQAIEFAQKVGADQTYFTHASHRIGLYEFVSKELPEGIDLAYDGLSFEV